MMTMKTLLLIALIVAASIVTSEGWAKGTTQRSRQSSSQLQMTLLTYQGKTKEFPPGSPLSKACAALGVSPKYNCRKGECGSCTLTVGGQRMKPCVGKVPPQPKLKSLQEKGLEIR